MNEHELNVHKANENPLADPIRNMWRKTVDIDWGFPWLPQIIQFLVQVLILLVFCVLYCTIGIAFHCYSIFASLLKNACEERRGSEDLIGKSAYALASGIYLVLAAPFAAIVYPFMMLGWMWKKMSWVGLILYVILVLGIVSLFFFWGWWEQNVFNLIRSIMHSTR